MISSFVMWNNSIIIASVELTKKKRDISCVLGGTFARRKKLILEPFFQFSAQLLLAFDSSCRWANHCLAFILIRKLSELSSSSTALVRQALNKFKWFQGHQILILNLLALLSSSNNFELERWDDDDDERIIRYEKWIIHQCNAGQSTQKSVANENRKFWRRYNHSDPPYMASSSTHEFVHFSLPLVNIN